MHPDLSLHSRSRLENYKGEEASLPFPKLLIVAYFIHLTFSPIQSWDNGRIRNLELGTTSSMADVTQMISMVLVARAVFFIYNLLKICSRRSGARTNSGH